MEAVGAVETSAQLTTAGCRYRTEDHQHLIDNRHASMETDTYNHDICYFITASKLGL
jgi:hypothetical protein